MEKVKYVWKVGSCQLRGTVGSFANKSRNKTCWYQDVSIKKTSQSSPWKSFKKQKNTCGFKMSNHKAVPLSVFFWIALKWQKWRNTDSRNLLASCENRVYSTLRLFGVFSGERDWLNLLATGCPLHCVHGKWNGQAGLTKVSLRDVFGKQCCNGIWAFFFCGLCENEIFKFSWIWFVQPSEWNELRSHLPMLQTVFSVKFSCQIPTDGVSLLSSRREMSQ